LPVTKIEKWRNYQDKKIERLVIYLITEYKELKIKIEAISLFACESKEIARVILKFDYSIIYSFFGKILIKSNQCLGSFFFCKNLHTWF
jgi:hypothetical protein